MYKIKTLAQRGSAFLAAVGLLSGVVTSALPALASADALNPLTERSLQLSSSSPGYHYKDGSGNTTYAPPGSGNNGQKTGETFTFKVSTDSSSSRAIKGFSFQYCTTSAGHCAGPGNDTWTDPDGPGGDPGSRDADDASHSDLSVNYSSSPVAGTDFKVEHYDPTANAGAGAWIDDSSISGTDWTIATDSIQDPTDPTDNTEKDNYITLANTTGLNVGSGTKIRITFIASANNYITNPGADAFFVKINDYDVSDTAHMVAGDASVIDGGVTVANVMNDSIQIQTKVLETMSFSVGTVNPDTVISGQTNANTHGSCDPILPGAAIELGDPDAEFSLDPGKAYAGTSYWRLSSNSSNGATVYYSGSTLSNTEGDQIDTINYGTDAGHANDGLKALSHPGTEQFGLALDTTADILDTTDTPTLTNTLTPLVAKTDYNGGAGLINESSAGANDITAKFAFRSDANTIPVPIADESVEVIHCSTGKMRYIANIAPDTPAGIYTSRINYVAAPEY